MFIWLLLVPSQNPFTRYEFTHGIKTFQVYEDVEVYHRDILVSLSYSTRRSFAHTVVNNRIPLAFASSLHICDACMLVLRQLQQHRRATSLAPCWNRRDQSANARRGRTTCSVQPGIRLPPAVVGEWHFWRQGAMGGCRHLMAASARTI